MQHPPLTVDVQFQTVPAVGIALVNAGWVGGREGDSVTINFPQTGRYEIELVAMGPLGGITPQSLSFAIDAQVSLPDTLPNR